MSGSVLLSSLGKQFSVFLFLSVLEKKSCSHLSHNESRLVKTSYLQSTYTYSLGLRLGLSGRDVGKREGCRVRSAFRLPGFRLLAPVSDFPSVPYLRTPLGPPVL